METNRQEAERILAERFGKDQVIALATISGQLPSVRYVNAYYADGAFYIITYGLSNKMRQLAENPAAGIAGEWFYRPRTGRKPRLVRERGEPGDCREAAGSLCGVD